jgi:hypothetical protein
MIDLNNHFSGICTTALHFAVRWPLVALSLPRVFNVEHITSRRHCGFRRCEQLDGKTAIGIRGGG